MMSKTKFELVKRYYENGLWKRKRVSDAVLMGWISEDEFLEITGEDYQKDRSLSAISNTATVTNC